ncbi:MAG: tRNA (adenosine(37)-N6)-threonylcarbamoyltransferase complex ATPase subunit type 1 TsaE [Lentisphaerae bacterium]|nr:tRNA (adenosine(37)-N6)-threonylcarbamoyltransferase complex ATPase subunit type 1 TsaE [Lentisphaerota bacterium]
MRKIWEQTETVSVEETRALAGRLAAVLPDGAVVCLYGDLGAGKTCFVQGLARALGVRRPVGSPTFTLINEYRGERGLAHIDLYRLRGAADAFGLGVEEYLEHFDGVVAIEWAERLGELAPEGCWRVWLEGGGEDAADGVRVIRVEGPAAV